MITANDSGQTANHITSDVILVNILTNLQKVINDVKTQVNQLQSDKIAPSRDSSGTNENSPGSKSAPSNPHSHFLASSGREDVVTAVAESMVPKPRYAERKDVSDLAFPPRTVARRHSISELVNHLSQNSDDSPVTGKRSTSMPNLFEINGEGSRLFPPPWLLSHLLDLDLKRRAHDIRHTDEKALQASQEGWPKMWSRFRSMDEAKVKDYKEDIDTLLVFAGLFSAIVTAFVIAFYLSLQPDSGDITTFILFQISSQLQSNFPVNGTSLDESQLSIPSFPFQAPGLSIRVNTLWFISLTFALATASFGILVKQWLREYMAMDDMSAAQQCRIRHLREVYMYRWRVFEIAAFLPLLLQASVILFLIGLSDFVRSLHPVVGWITTSFIVVYLVLFAAALLLPMIFVHCPYKTPFLKTILQLPRYLYLKVLCTLTSYQHRVNNGWTERNLWMSTTLKILRFIRIRLDKLSPPPFTTVSLFRLHGFSAFEKAFYDDRRLDIPVVISADGSFLDRDLEATYRSCLTGLPWSDMQGSILFSPAYTACTGMDTAKGFQTLMDDAAANPLISRSVIAEIVSDLMMIFMVDGGTIEFRSYLDAAAYWVLNDSSHLGPQPVESVRSRLPDLVINSEMCASYVLQFLASESTQQDIYWYQKGVDHLIRAGVNLVQMDSSLWHCIEMMDVLCRAILQQDVYDRSSVQEKFAEFLDAILPDLESGRVWNDLAPYERQSTKKRALACFQHFRDLNADINGYIPNNVVAAMRNFTLMKEEGD